MKFDVGQDILADRKDLIEHRPGDAFDGPEMVLLHDVGEFSLVATDRCFASRRDLIHNRLVAPLSSGDLLRVPLAFMPFSKNPGAAALSRLAVNIHRAVEYFQTLLTMGLVHAPAGAGRLLTATFSTTANQIVRVLRVRLRRALPSFLRRR
jgi:hypothetical protein